MRMKRIFGLLIVALMANMGLSPCMAEEADRPSSVEPDTATAEAGGLSPDEEARILAALEKHRPRLHTMAEMLKQRDPERYQQFLQKLLRWKGRKAPHAMKAASPEVTAIREKLAALRKANAERRERLQQLRAAYQAADPEAQPALRKEIRQLVETAFDATTERKQLEIEERRLHLKKLEERLDEAAEQLERRKANRDTHIDRFVTRLLPPDTRSP